MVENRYPYGVKQPENEGGRQAGGCESPSIARSRGGEPLRSAKRA